MSFHYVLQVGVWLNSEGEQMLKDSDAADSLVSAEKALQRYDLFHAQAKVRQQQGFKSIPLLLPALFPHFPKVSILYSKLLFLL